MRPKDSTMFYSAMSLRTPLPADPRVDAPSITNTAIIAQCPYKGDTQRHNISRMKHFSFDQASLIDHGSVDDEPSEQLMRRTAQLARELRIDEARAERMLLRGQT